METEKLLSGFQSLGLDVSQRTLTLVLCGGALGFMLLGAAMCEILGRRRLILIGGAIATLAAVSSLHIVDLHALDRWVKCFFGSALLYRNMQWLVSILFAWWDRPFWRCAMLSFHPRGRTS